MGDAANTNTRDPLYVGAYTVNCNCSQMGYLRFSFFHLSSIPFMDLIFLSHCIDAKSIRFSLKDALTFSFSNVKFMVESLMKCWSDPESDSFFLFIFDFGVKIYLGS